MEEVRRMVGKIWTACSSRSKKNSTSHLFWLVQTCPNLFTPVHPCSHVFTPVHTCSPLFTPVHPCSPLFTPVHTCSHPFTPQWLFTLFAQWQFLVEFSPCENCYFSILCAILLKLHTFADLIKSYPTVHGLSRCIEIKMLIPLAAHTTVTLCMLVAQCHFLHFPMLSFFSLACYPAEIAYFNSPDRELSNFIRLMELYWSKIVGPSRSPWLKTVQRKSFERSNFLVLRPVLLKSAYFNSANR